MAIKKTIASGGNARQIQHAPFVANTVTQFLVEHVFKENIAATGTDILEFAQLPAYCRLLNAEIIGVNTGAVTAEVGLMTGEPFDTDPARTMNGIIFPAATALGTLQQAPLDRLLPIQGVGVNRSIGVRFSAAIAADITKRLIMRLTYAAT